MSTVTENRGRCGIEPAPGSLPEQASPGLPIINRMPYPSTNLPQTAGSLRRFSFLAWSFRNKRRRVHATAVANRRSIPT